MFTSNNFFYYALQCTYVIKFDQELRITLETRNKTVVCDSSRMPGHYFARLIVLRKINSPRTIIHPEKNIASRFVKEHLCCKAISLNDKSVCIILQSYSSDEFCKSKDDNFKIKM